MSVIVDVSSVYSWLISQRFVSTDSRLVLIVRVELSRLYTLCYDPFVESEYVSHVSSRWGSFSKDIVEFPLRCLVDDVQRGSLGTPFSPSLCFTNTSWNVRESQWTSRF